MDDACMEFGLKCLHPFHVTDKRILEAGALNVNGSYRPFVEDLSPTEYIGVDMQPGNGVDIVSKIEDTTFPPESFDTIICVSMLEHSPDWKAPINHMKSLLKSGGLFVFTVPSPGFKKHDYPGDYWRFTKSDILKIFSDFSIFCVETSGPSDPQVYLAAIKPHYFTRTNLSDIEVAKVE